MHKAWMQDGTSWQPGDVCAPASYDPSELAGDVVAQARVESFPLLTREKHE